MNESTLLLNSSFEALGSISVQRAICLVFRDQVYVEEYHETRVMRSINSEWKVPSVVRLKHYIDVRKRRRNTAMKRTRIYLRDKNKCCYCGVRGTDKELTLDHVIPKSRGGIASPENLVTCCFPCNQKKADRTPEEARMVLRIPPRKLTMNLDHVISHAIAEKNPTWKKYMGLSDEGDSRYQHTD